MNDEEKKKHFKEFLSSGDVMVIDKSSASRRRLIKTLVDMGGNRQKMHSVSHFNEAIDIVRDKHPKIILSDYDLNGGSGFELFKEFREQYPDDKSSMLILVTSNISQSAVAKAAEEDVDSFILKPYTVQSLEKSLINTVISKLYPSEYVKTIEAGKELMFAGSYDEALVTFEKAIPLNKKPSLAMFYHGQTKYMMKLVKEAEGDYKKGLEINSIHFKCQVGLYELFMKDKKFAEAYSVIRNLAKYFPANPARLKEVVRLAVMTKNYKDMEMYYDVFVTLDERPEEAINYVCSGLFVAAKYFFEQGNIVKGSEIFEKIGVSCAGMSKFLLAMIKVLVEREIFDQAATIAGRISSGPDNQENYMLGNYLASSNMTNNTELISKGMELWNQGFKDPDAVKILIEALKKDGSDEKAQEYIEEARFKWPEIFSDSTSKAA